MTTLTLTKRQPEARPRPLGPDDAAALQRQTGWRTLFYAAQYADGQWRVFPEPAAESPANFTFLREREVAKLRAFAELASGWDSYGALPIDPVAIERAIELIQNPAFIQLLPAFSPRLAAFPLRNGGVQLDLNGGKAPMEIEVFPTGEVEFTLFGPDDEVVWEASTLELATRLYQDVDVRVRELA